MNKIIELHHKFCAKNPNYLKYVTAKTDAESVEGLLWLDTVMAARILRSDSVNLSLLKIADIANVLSDLLGRAGPTVEERQELQCARMAFHDLDDDDLKRAKQFARKPQ